MGQFKAVWKPAVVRCGSSADEVIYEEGLNRVAEDRGISCTLRLQAGNVVSKGSSPGPPF